jgi:CubicO group peptidase (beta-lactamase class C family)
MVGGDRHFGAGVLRPYLLVAAALAAMLGYSKISCAQTDSQVAINLGSYFYAEDKTYTDSSVLGWPTAMPAATGMNGERLTSGAGVLAADSNSASFLVVRGGKLVHESYFNGGQAAHSKNVHSVSKSFLSALTGIAIDRGIVSLNTRLGDVLSNPMSPEKANITVGNLLTMKSGLQWMENKTAFELPGANFTQEILDLPLTSTPGTTFNYSDGDAHLLAAVLTQASGMSLHQFAKNELFAPLGIDVEGWGRDRQGVFSGYDNLFVTPRELAAFGQLYLAGGRAPDGTQLVPASWVTQSTSSQSSPSYYGYYWLNGYRGYRAWGYGQQFIYTHPSLDLVTVITYDTANKVSDGDLNHFVRDYVIGAVTGPATLAGDFNHDGRVDAADYIVWRNGLGSSYSQLQYNEWRNNFGATLLGASAGAAALPEPRTAMLWVLGAVLLSARRRK